MASKIEEMLAGRVTVTIAEAADALGVSEKSLRTRIARHPEEIPTVRLGRRVLVPSAWVQQIAAMPSEQKPY